MAGDVGFGGTASGGSYTAGNVYSDGIGLPTGRAMYNGSQACLITALFAYVGAKDTAKAISLSLGSSGTGAFTVGVHASDSGTGWVGSSAWLVWGGTARFQVNSSPSGTLYIGRGGGGTVYGPAGWSRAGTLGGAYRYVEAPNAPTVNSLEVTSTPGQLKVNFSGSTDNGGTGVTSYRLWWWAEGESVDAHYVDGITASGYLLSNLPLGKIVNVRLSARNWVTDAASTVGTPSNTGTLFVPGGGSIRVGGVWVPRLRKIRVAGAWKNVSRRIRVGGAWTSIK